MNDSLLQPYQCLLKDVHIDVRPKSYFPNGASAQSITIEDKILPLEFNGPLPYIQVRRPTKEEYNTCQHYELTSHDEWDPYTLLSTVNMLNSTPTSEANEESNLHSVFNICSISSELMNNDYFEILDDHRELYVHDNEYHSISAINTKQHNTLTPEELSRLWGIGLKNARRTLAATSHRCVKTVGELTRRFRTDKVHMRYRRLSTKHGLFYVDTLKSKVKSI